MFINFKKILRLFLEIAFYLYNLYIFFYVKGGDLQITLSVSAYVLGSCVMT